MFISALALTFGLLSKTNRLFETVYSFIWYFGLIEKVPVFDFIGATGTGLMNEMPITFLGITFVIIMLAGIWRWREQQIL